MSDSRQATLFAGETFESVYKSFSDINFTAYDFDTLRSSLIDYVRIHYPEDFNDYIESSEFIAIIELISYLGTSLAFRSDLNARENIMDTAERRESIVKLARMLSYHPKRAIPATGLFKITSVRTDQPITDSTGRRLNGSEIFWGDDNNTDWYDQFVSVVNAALNPTNKMGKPTKSETVAGIRTDLYAMNNVLGIDVAYPVDIVVNGESIGFDIVNPDIDTIIKERHPDINQAFNLIYRNDSKGMSSSDTGLFLYLKQGNLTKQDYQYNFPLPNRIQDYTARNVNNDDVYVQEINDIGEVITKWTKVPAVNGNNVIYNTLNRNERNIFEVISGLNDTISIKYPDGNFGDTPTGLIRTWYRTSNARNVIVRPDDASDLFVTIPYYGADGQRYNLSLSFSLERTISNGANPETDAQIKRRAPLVYYTQNRMINDKDYNVFPLTYGNQIVKLRAINRTFSGHSRYTNTDPTGFNQGLKVFSDDGALFNEISTKLETVDLDPNITGASNPRVKSVMSRMIKHEDMYNFYTLEYLRTIPDQSQFEFTVDTYWKTFPNYSRGNRGALIYNNTPSTPNWPYDDYVVINNAAGNPYKYVTAGSTIKLRNPNNNEITTTPINAILDEGVVSDPLTTEQGPIILSDAQMDLIKMESVIPRFRNYFNDAENSELEVLLYDTEDIFYRYDVENDAWYFSTDGSTAAEYDQGNPLANWFGYLRYIPATSSDLPYYEVVSRGIYTVFESYNSVRFYWDPEEIAIDSGTGRTKRDTISILSGVNVDSIGNKLDKNIDFDIIDTFIQDDGFVNQARVKVLPSDKNEDRVPDDPFAFYTIVGTGSEVLFERVSNFDGYLMDRIWVPRVANIDNAVVNITHPATIMPNVLYVTVGDGARISVTRDINDPLSIERHYYLSNNDLFVFEDISLLNELARQLGLLLLNPLTNSDALEFIEVFKSKSMTVGMPSDRNGVNLHLYNFGKSLSGNTIIVNDPRHYSRIGRTFTNDGTNSGALNFRWDHHVSRSQLIDPSKTNLIDMIVLTNEYYRRLIEWKDGGLVGKAPMRPTTEDLRNTFSHIEEYKSISDEITYTSGVVKFLFGEGARPELRARFKAIKIQDSNVTDNEIRTGVINAIEEYFNINNWEFGEKFYYTELAAYIHSRMSRSISSIVLVPTSNNSTFGDLFEIKAEPNEIFLSTATPLDVDIVTNYNDSNMRR